MFLDIVKIIIAIAAAISGIALIRGQSKWNRLLGLNLVSGKITMIIIILAVSSGNTFYLDIAIVYVMLSFIGVTALADYIVDVTKILTPIGQNLGLDCLTGRSRQIASNQQRQSRVQARPRRKPWRKAPPLLPRLSLKSSLNPRWEAPNELEHVEFVAR